MDKSIQSPKYIFVLKEKRVEKGLRQSELAKLVGVGVASVQRYENGQRTPDVMTAYRFAQALDCRIEDLIMENKIEEEAIL